jgi:hypothetical protein
VFKNRSVVISLRPLRRCLVRLNRLSKRLTGLYPHYSSKRSGGGR